MTNTERAKGVAVITGAASGMGEAAANLMSDVGWPLLLCDINAERLNAAAERLRTRTQVTTVVCDISDPNSLKTLASALNNQQIGALIHCAGVSPTMVDSARMLDINLAGTIRLVDVVRPLMSEGGAAVLFASSAAHQLGTKLDQQISAATTPEAVASLATYAQHSGAAYTIAKRGVYLLAQREAAAFGRRGARIVSVSPGIIDTPMGRAEMATHPIMKTLVENSALRRRARAEEVAAVAVFLCSPAASFVTGTDILVDGGATVGTPMAG